MLSGSGMGSDAPSSSPRRPFGGPATPHRHRFPFGTFFENPKWTGAATRTQGDTSVEHFIVVDRSRGYFRTTSWEARELAEIGYPVFDLAGHQPVWNPPLNIPGREQVQAEAFKGQLTEIYDLEDEIENIANAHLDEEIFYDTNEKRFKRRKVMKSSKDKGNGPNADDKRDPPSGAGAASSGTPVLA